MSEDPDLSRVVLRTRRAPLAATGMMAELCLRLEERLRTHGLETRHTTTGAVGTEGHRVDGCVRPRIFGEQAGAKVAIGTGTRNDSSTEHRSPSFFRKKSGSTRRPRLRRHGLLSKSQPLLSQCR